MITQEIKEMNVSRKLGIVVFCMVPAIIGGGIIYAIFHSYMPVFIYEILLLFTAGAFVSR
jgi:zinc transporter ZupT